MSRPHAPILVFAALFAITVLSLLAIGCGGDSQEQELEKATATLVEARESAQEARVAVEARQQAVDEALKELDAAKKQLKTREATLRDAESRVGLKATDATLFRSVQRRLLDDEGLDDLAITAKASKGVITLFGVVPDEKARGEAEKIARETPGVVSVENRIEVTPPAPAK